MKTYKTILLLGIIAAGKDTQADLISSKLKIQSISTGELIREEIAKEITDYRDLREVINKGDLIEDYIVYDMLRKELKKYSVNSPLILNGAVRREHQIVLLDKALEEVGRKLDMVIYLDLEDQIAIDRLSKRVHDKATGKTYHLEFNPPPKNAEIERRHDDKPEVIKQRLVKFHKYIDIILAEYKRRNILKVFNANTTIENLNNNIINYLTR